MTFHQLFQDLFRRIPSPLRSTTRYSLESILRALQDRFSLHPTLVPASGISERLRLPGMVRARLLRHRIPRWMQISLFAGLVLAVLVHEVSTSAIQAWLFSRWAAGLTYTLGPGPSPQVVFPTGGPFDQRLGYTRIPEFERRLEAQGYHVLSQARFSRAAARLASWGILPPYQEPTLAGLVIHDRGGALLYDSTLGHGIFRDIDEVPPLLLNTILFIEDRRLQGPTDPRENPVVDWARFAKAGALYAGHKLGLPLPPEGGSTLATQLEKFQHSDRGRTSSPFEKLRQMTSASLKVYREGTDTHAERREILLRYLNEVPLAAAPGWGEVNGLGDGLAAWFGMSPAELPDRLALPSPTPEKAWAYKHVLALLCAVRSPTYYLVHHRAALGPLVDLYTALLQEQGMIDSEFARRVRATPIAFLRTKATPPGPLILQRKAINHLRLWLGRRLGEPSLYALDRLHLEADSTLDLGLQQNAGLLFDRLRDRDFLARHGLIGEHLLGGGNPRDVVYSFLLLERTPLGNVVRAHTDTLDRPFDVNDGMKMELGSTAKLRTLAHYLELMTGLFDEFLHLDSSMLEQRALAARDPLTRWAAETIRGESGLNLEVFLQRALDRTYSASPGEVFFTSGGAQTFGNYDRHEDSRVYSVRDGLIYSVNLVYIRLMRDIVRFHEANLPYDAHAVLDNPEDSVRHRMLGEIAATESTAVLEKAYREYRDLASREVVARLLGQHAKDARRLAMLFFAWHVGAGEEALGRWLESRGVPVSSNEPRRLVKAYGNPQLTLADFGFLLGRHPLEVWCAGELVRTPGISWNELLLRSEEPRRIASAWLFKTRNRHAQDLRLRARIEQDVFARMTPSWRRLGFPFKQLVPSLATAIGSSSDRPDALAELMGIIQNDGVRLSTVDVGTLRFATGTPYETVLGRVPETGERVMPGVVARTLRSVLADVVNKGTAIRAAGAFVNAEGAAIPVGGKTGSGDNRYKTFARGGGLISSRPVSRTAAFVFYIGDRYFGIITASVAGKESGNFHFTSVLPVALLKLLAPAVGSRLQPTPTLAENALG